jgi:hypothetical protein
MHGGEALFLFNQTDIIGETETSMETRRKNGEEEESRQRGLGIPTSEISTDPCMWGSQPRFAGRHLRRCW